MANYMKKKGYHFEEKLIRTVANWRRASEEVGHAHVHYLNVRSGYRSGNRIRSAEL